MFYTRISVTFDQINNSVFDIIIMYIIMYLKRVTHAVTHKSYLISRFTKTYFKK